MPNGMKSQSVISELSVAMFWCRQTGISSASTALQYWYCNLSLTDTSVTAILASGFTYSVYPCLRVFHETPTMQVANSQHASTCTLERESRLVAYLERKSSVVAFLLVTFNSSDIAMVAHILEVVSKYEERMQKVPRFSHGRRMVRADGIDPSWRTVLFSVKFPPTYYQKTKAK